MTNQPDTELASAAENLLTDIRHAAELLNHTINGAIHAACLYEEPDPRAGEAQEQLDLLKPRVVGALYDLSKALQPAKAIRDNDDPDNQHLYNLLDMDTTNLDAMRSLDLTRLAELDGQSGQLILDYQQMFGNYCQTIEGHLATMHSIATKHDLH